jgi:hypothetical protein
MWRRWVGLVVGAALGYSGGASLAARALTMISGNDPGSQISAGFAGALIVGPLCALVGAVVGYQRGRTADTNRRGLRR